MGYQEILGADEILGASDDALLAEILSGEQMALGADEILGRAAVPSSAKQRLLMRNAALIKERSFDRLRRYLLGLQSLAVGAAAQVTINQQPQYPFRPYRYIIPATFAVNFVIDQINIGQQPVLVAAGAVPAECFSEVAVGGDALWDTASIGNQVSVLTTNIGVGAQDFRSAMFGTIGKD